MYYAIFSGFLLFLAFQNVEMHTYHLGGCPDIEPVRDFKINRMLGIWYVIEKTSTLTSCIAYNISRSEKPNEYKIDEITQNFLLQLTPVRHDSHHHGILTIPDPSVPARINVKYPWRVALSSTFTVFMTDYDNYAGVYSCQKLPLSHRESATILSRTRTLDNVYLEKLHSKLASLIVNPFDLSVINQEDCPKNLTSGYSIDLDTSIISTKSAANAIRKTGEKLADGVEYLSDKVKDAYHKITDSNESDEENTTRPQESDWLP